MTLDKPVPNELSAFRILHESKFPGITFLGLEDAPAGSSIQVLIQPCDADPRNPLTCVIARNIEDAKAQLQSTLPLGYGKVMAEGITITSDRAYVAVKVPLKNEYRILKYNHDGAWVVNAFDSEDPKRLAKMWQRINRGGDAAIVTLKRFRPSQTIEGRDLARLNKIKRLGTELLNDGAITPAKKVPQRGNRKNGLSPRRIMLARLAEEARS